MAASKTARGLQHIDASQGSRAVLDAFRQDGGVIIKRFVAPENAKRIDQEVQHELERLEKGSKINDEWLQNFHGHNTKRLNNLTTHSETFRQYILENDLVYDVCREIFVEDSGTFWINTAQLIEIGPGSEAQTLHRDSWQFPVFTLCGAAAPEAMVNFMIALTPFTAENGATRVIPGSHQWADFHEVGSPEDAVAAEMEPGDACLISGKTVHSGGANQTADFLRRGIALVVQCSYITPEEAHPFLIPKALAESLSPRAQRMLAFRCQFPKDSPGVWKCDYSETDDTFYYPQA